MASGKSSKALQREQTHQALIETAESLFAEHGIAAVSLRQIADRAGSLNTSVVGYYFGSKEALIEAIYRHRLPHIEKWRARFLAEIDRKGLGMDLNELLKAICIPWYEQRDSEGRHSYGRFLKSIDRAGMIWTRFALDKEYPASLDLHNRIKRYFEIYNVPNPEFRFTVQVNMFIDALYYIDVNELSEEEAKEIMVDALAMARVAISTGGKSDF